MPHVLYTAFTHLIFLRKEYSVSNCWSDSSLISSSFITFCSCWVSAAVNSRENVVTFKKVKELRLTKYCAMNFSFDITDRKGHLHILLQYIAVSSACDVDCITQLGGQFNPFFNNPFLYFNFFFSCTNEHWNSNSPLPIWNRKDYILYNLK